MSKTGRGQLAEDKHNVRRTIAKREVLNLQELVEEKLAEMKGD